MECGMEVRVLGAGQYLGAMSRFCDPLTDADL